MHDAEVSRKISLVAVAAAAILIVGMMIAVAPRTAEAMPEYAAQTGRACGVCHVNKAGSGPLTPAGQKYRTQKKK